MSKERRQHVRVKGPFDGFRVGALDTPVEIYDLSEGGCFVNSFHEPPDIGRRLKLRIDLPGQPRLSLNAEVCYARLGGYAVRFAEVPGDTKRRLKKAIEDLIGTGPEETTNLT